MNNPRWRSLRLIMQILSARVILVHRQNLKSGKRLISKFNPKTEKKTMKKYLLAAALTVMGCGMTSCSNDAEDVIEQNEQAQKVTKLVFTVAQEAQTRAEWGGTNGRTPMFENNDKVSLFSAHNDNVELTAHVSGGTVTLEGEGTSGDTELYFVYPYCATAKMTDGKITSTDNAAPYYINGNGEGGAVTIGTIGVNKYPANALSLAKSNDGGASAITFKGLMAILKYTPTATKTGLIKLAGYDSGMNFFAPYGKITIDVAQEKITTQYTDGMEIYFPQVYNASVTGYSFVAGTSYYMAFPPYTAPQDYQSVFATRPFTSNIKLWTGTKTFEAGKIYSVSK